MTSRLFEFLRPLPVFLLILLSAVPALAQFRVEVSGVGLTQLPIAVSAFRGDDASPQKIGAIIQADLERSGQFRGIDTGGGAMDEVTRPDVSVWRQKGADSLLAGTVTRLADGRFDVRFRLWDVVRGQDLGGQSYAVTQGDLRLSAHRIADFVYEKLTGEKGIFSTRIAYVTKAGTRFNLWVADADGENAQTHWPAWNPSSHRPGRPMAGNWRMCLLSRANRWFTSTMWPAASGV